MSFRVEEFVFEELDDQDFDSTLKGKYEMDSNTGFELNRGLDTPSSVDNKKSSTFIIDKETVKRELENIVETTKKQALEEARLIKEQAKKEGFEMGYREGYEKGLKDAKNIFDETIREYTLKVQQAIDKLVETAKEISKKYEELENLATDMVLDIAKKVISKELETNREAVNSMVKDAIGLSDSKKLKIKLNPKDASKLSLSSLPNNGGIEVVKDSKLSEGSVIIEEENGNVIDASVDTKLEQIKSSLINE